MESFATRLAGAPDSYLDLVVGAERLKAVAIRLYPEERVQKWRGYIAVAQQRLGGDVSTSGFALAGSAGWVVGMGLAMSALEGLATAGKVHEGRQALGAARIVYNELRSGGRLFRVDQITNLDLPSPSAWVAAEDGASFVTTGDDFVWIETAERGPIQLRWSAVTAYSAVVDGRHVEPPPVVTPHDPAAYFLG